MKDDVEEKARAASRHPAVLIIGGTAVIGAVIGSFIPVLGTAIGAGIGGILGGIGVIVGGVKNRKLKNVTGDPE
jgi:hypothetical protein